MPLDPDVRRLLDGSAAQLAFPAGARHDPDRATAFLAGLREKLNAPVVNPSEPIIAVHDERMDNGRAVRVYTGSAEPDRPVLIYLHGGGWACGGLEMNDVLCRRLATRTETVLVSVDYRLAPEHPYPAALIDTVEALGWARQHARRLGGDPAWVGIAGTSAGGNLAAAACLLARELGLDAPALQVLLYPVTDVPADNGSYVANGTGYLLSREQMEWYWDAYLPDRDRTVPAYAAPCRATDLSGLPPAVVVSAEYDPLRDEAENYAAALKQAGVPVTLLRCEGLIHGFLPYLGVVPAADTALERILEAISQRWR